ncbi:uncharacterized protein LOC100898171 [Galendromus occidentalis]|uniref:Uncharacterized protein LOC100898171 n=1 Tax=Galendromus occidentalis TaxID=34638 RepID=A0AAJ6QS98_9ACAR|nr:uncharacterized protein LOC100898171 [Galendromus occidentalis]
MAGSDKRELLIIGHSVEPICISDFKLENFQFSFFANNNARITTPIFGSWLAAWDEELQRVGRRILLLVDDCIPRPHVESFKNIVFELLPTNAIAKIQPLSLGVIDYFKTSFSARLQESLNQAIEQSSTRASPELNLMQAALIAADSWNNDMSFTGRDELKSLFVIARHSIRAPIFYPPHDEFLNPKPFSRGPGYLTQKGIDSAVRVGKIWKRWYPDLITGNAREVWARSSESYRCAETAQSILYSIYTTESHYQPISVIVPPSNTDKYTSSNSLSDEELSKCMDGYYGIQVKSIGGKPTTVADVLRFVAEKLGLADRSADAFDMFIYLDGIESLRYENLEQPPWYTSNKESIDEVYGILYDRITSTLRPYYGYFLLRGLADRMKLLKDGKPPYGDKWSLFLEHDFSISATLSGLDQGFEKLKANFLGAVFFEMYQRKTDGSHYMKLFWSRGLQSNGTYCEKEPLNLKGSNGTNEIAFDDLWAKFRNNVFEDYMTDSKHALIGYTGEDALV